MQRPDRGLKWAGAVIGEPLASQDIIGMRLLDAHSDDLESRKFHLVSQIAATVDALWICKSRCISFRFRKEAKTVLIHTFTYLREASAGCSFY